MILDSREKDEHRKRDIDGLMLSLHCITRSKRGVGLLMYFAFPLSITDHGIQAIWECED